MQNNNFNYKQQYLVSIKRRSMLSQKLEGGGSSSIASGCDPERRVPASLSGVSVDDKSIL